MTAPRHSYLSRYTSAGGRLMFQAMGSDGLPLSQPWEDKTRALGALSHFADPRFGGLRIRSEIYDGDAGAWVREFCPSCHYVAGSGSCSCLSIADLGSPAPPQTTCVETIGGDPNTALRLSFQIRVF